MTETGETIARREESELTRRLLRRERSRAGARNFAVPALSHCLGAMADYHHLDLLAKEEE